MCANGYALNSSQGSCIQITRNSPCSSKCASCQITNSIAVCLLCLPSFTLVNGKCVLCMVGCSLCSSSSISVCLSCSFGNYLDSFSGNCLPCSLNCFSCNSNGCTVCTANYTLTSFTCAVDCSYPCSSCSVGNSAICFSCFAGYIYNLASQCL